MDHTSKMIAFSIIAVFAAGLIGAGIVAAFINKDNAEWFNLFKEGFLILSGAVATIIGYYFGSKDKAIKDSEKRTSEMDQQADARIINELLSSEAKDQPSSSQRTDIPIASVEGMTPAVTAGDDE